MLSKIIEGDKFKSPFSEKIFKVKKVYTNTALLEDVEEKGHWLITEIATVVSFYQRADKRSFEDSYLRKGNHENRKT